ncbi:hypothetical protein LSTR_LSTR014865 [Laodelphax striatellus]|uniref:Uncharacterized protein n=1 Tax=Laodelphax striatellus TaxID=195883 RepID=A0A482WTB6_LAOST|nr:hypothetical protein LSTR_LSTR014865 [Laodelphax striatellus]
MCRQVEDSHPARRNCNKEFRRFCLPESSPEVFSISQLRTWRKAGKGELEEFFSLFFQSGIRRQAVRSRREAVGKINAGNSEPAISRQRHFSSGLTPKNKVLHLTSKAYVRPRPAKTNAFAAPCSRGS